MALFDDLSQVTLFIILTLTLFSEWFLSSKNSNLREDSRKLSQSSRQKENDGVGHSLLPVVNFVVIILWEISFFSFFKNAFYDLPQDTNWPISLLVFVVLFQIVMWKRWLINFYHGTNRGFSFLLLVGMSVTMGIYLGVTGYFGFWLEFSTFIPFLLVWASACALTWTGKYDSPLPSPPKQSPIPTPQKKDNPRNPTQGVEDLLRNKGAS